ncbi:MAG: glycine--tRNA ligase [Bdellovibrionales bacterium GWB1_52_6]|nr:MAG: glycine--tRNA ligase [Bdellovibrionales bacterium GWB1_52_6]OFZ03550.1 MAG: glycine--tRNA ligase [Bdellovibrionales bacterium GWA1_52_35]HCM41046.1 glycine--tRNA ligase [Bdellovibrionales bacterium]
MADLVSLCKRRGFVFPSSEVYGGINACWDYGPLGIELKRNVKERWWRAMVDREDVEGLDAAILMHPKVWEASGHVAGFVDPLVDCKKCKSRFRADKIDAEAMKSKKCPECGGELTEPRQFNLMFRTFMGPLEDAASVVYLRPETAQGIYVNFLNVQQSTRKKVPFGIAQIGKAFRNEITPGNFIFRTREFEQMEMQFFVKPGTDVEWFERWKQTRIEWHLANGIRKNKLRFHEHGAGELAHYAKAAFDIEYEFPFGWQELEGIHNRTDFDLGRHQQFSGKKLEYFDEEHRERYLPYIVETSAGCDRTLLVALADAYRFDGERVWLALHPHLAPYKVAVYPLMKKPELKEYTETVYADLKKNFRVTTDEAGSIGKRYRRQDEIGTPFGVTIDYDTLSNHTVTVRHRDSMAQERVSTDKLSGYIQDKIHNWEK